ncbi:MAG: T9SS type A sorting domain-containing protein [Chitinophagales bacterium]|nr:T9SS type A sorting domain-containing protein [Chitinophagales bacterium]
MKSLVYKIFGKESISIFPNPTTKGKVVNLMVNSKGNYYVELINDKSVLLHTQQIHINNKEEINLFNIPSNIREGNYFIKVINKLNNKEFIKTIKVQ